MATNPNDPYAQAAANSGIVNGAAPAPGAPGSPYQYGPNQSAGEMTPDTGTFVTGTDGSVSILRPPDMGAPQPPVGAPPPATPPGEPRVAVDDFGLGAPGVVNAAGPQAPTVTPAAPKLYQVESSQTVQGQLDAILRKGNPLLEAAESRARQQANARGLMNTSMATQAGQEAIVNTAMPIAQQDARTYQMQALANQEVENKFEQMRYGSDLDLRQQYEKFLQDSNLQDKDNALKRYITDKTIDSNEKIAVIDANSRIATANISAGAAVGAARINAEADFARIVSNEKIMGEQLNFQRNQEVNRQSNFQDTLRLNTRQLDLQSVNSYANSVNQINVTDMDPQSKNNAKADLSAIYTGSGVLPNVTTQSAISTAGFPTWTPAAPTTPTPTGGEGGGSYTGVRTEQP